MIRQQPCTACNTYQTIPSYGSSFGTFTAALLGHAWLICCGGCSCLNLIGSGFVVVPFGDDFLDSFEILEHRARQFQDCLVSQVVLVPPCKGELRQDDTRMSSFGEWNISALHRCNSQRAVFIVGSIPMYLLRISIRVTSALIVTSLIVTFTGILTQHIR